jgi:glycosyltransferase involved in cell wall biosynthesis
MGKEIYYMIADYRACGWYRCYVPAVELNSIGHHAIVNDSLHPGDIPMLDVIVFQRGHTQKDLDAISVANSLGKTTVYEIDDDFWNLDKANTAYPYWSRPGVLQTAESVIRKAKVVTTTTPRLAHLLSRFNKNVVVLPNMLPDECWKVRKPKKSADNRIVIGWAGSRTHFEDLKVLGGTIEQLLDEYPNIEFHVAGVAEVPFYPHERAMGVPSVPIADYADLLKTFDIGIAPLTGSHFNKCKSDLKFVEYSKVGIPSVVSKTESYEATVKNNENGFLASNSKDWLKYLRRLIEDADLRARIGGEAKKFAETRTIGSNIWLWEKAYGIE